MGGLFILTHSGWRSEDISGRVVWTLKVPCVDTFAILTAQNIVCIIQGFKLIMAYRGASSTQWEGKLQAQICSERISNFRGPQKLVMPKPTAEIRWCITHIITTSVGQIWAMPGDGSVYIVYLLLRSSPGAVLCLCTTTTLELLSIQWIFG